VILILMFVVGIVIMGHGHGWRFLCFEAFPHLNSRGLGSLKSRHLPFFDMTRVWQKIVSALQTTRSFFDRRDHCAESESLYQSTAAIPGINTPKLDNINKSIPRLTIVRLGTIHKLSIYSNQIYKPVQIDAPQSKV
jgi:hypothetical protein